MRFAMPRWLQGILFAAVSLAAYFTGILTNETGFGDVTTTQWLGAVVALGVAFGIGTTPTSDPHVVARVTNEHVFTAGEAASLPTGMPVSPQQTLEATAENNGAS